MRGGTRIGVIICFLLAKINCEGILNGTKDQDHPCEKKTDMLLKIMLNENITIEEFYDLDYWKFFLHSGTNFNDLGDYEGCMKMNYSKFFLVHFENENITSNNKTTSYDIGFCYFKECDKDYLYKVKYDVVYLLQKLFGVVPFFENYTVTFIEPKVLNDDYRKNLQIGLIFTICLIFLFLVLSIIQCFKINLKKRTKSVRTGEILLLEEDINQLNEIDGTIYNHENEFSIHKTNLNINHNETHISNITHLTTNPSISDVKFTRNKKTKLETFLLFFDINKNIFNLFHKIYANPIEEKLKIFNGLKFLSVCWVLLSHSFAIAGSVGFKNYIEVPDFLKSFGICFIISGLYSIDILFYITGFLLNMEIQKYVKDIASSSKGIFHKTKIFLKLILQRYIFIFPLYMFSLFSLTYLLPIIGDGLNLYKLEERTQGSTKYFWYYFLFINNFFNHQDEDKCFKVTFYIAIEMQLYIFTLFIFIFLSRVRYFIITSLFVLSNLFQIYSIIEHNYTFLDFVNFNPDNKNFISEFYFKPWNRISPFILGLLFSVMFMQSDFYTHNLKTVNYSNLSTLNKKISESKLITFVIFICSILLSISSIIVNIIPNNYELSNIWHAWFLVVNNLIFVISIACVIHLTLLGKLTFFYNILSVNLFSYMSQLTNGILLIHEYIILFMLVTFPNLLYLNIIEFSFNAFGYIIYCSIISFFLTLLIQSPIVNMINCNQNKLDVNRIKYINN